jgi:hypothetical protein
MAKVEIKMGEIGGGGSSSLNVDANHTFSQGSNTVTLSSEPKSFLYFNNTNSSYKAYGDTMYDVQTDTYYNVGKSTQGITSISISGTSISFTCAGSMAGYVVDIYYI